MVTLFLLRFCSICYYFLFSAALSSTPLARAAEINDRPSVVSGARASALDNIVSSWSVGHLRHRAKEHFPVLDSLGSPSHLFLPFSRPAFCAWRDHWISPLLTNLISNLSTFSAVSLFYGTFNIWTSIRFSSRPLFSKIKIPFTTGERKTQTIWLYSWKPRLLLAPSLIHRALVRLYLVDGPVRNFFLEGVLEKERGRTRLICLTFFVVVVCLFVCFSLSFSKWKRFFSCCPIAYILFESKSRHQMFSIYSHLDKYHSAVVCVSVCSSVLENKRLISEWTDMMGVFHMDNNCLLSPVGIGKRSTIRIWLFSALYCPSVDRYTFKWTHTQHLDRLEKSLKIKSKQIEGEKKYKV